MENMEIEKKIRFWENKKILVTGHEGFIGSWLVKTLLSYKADIVGLDKVKKRSFSTLKGLRKNIVCLAGDITNLKSVRNVINKHKPEIIFHLAAETIVGEAHKNPMGTFESNIKGTWNILEASRNRKFIKAIIVASSDKAYGEHEKLPYLEDVALKGNHPYDASKSCADLLTSTYFNTYNLPVCITRCGNIYGEGDFHFSRIVPDAIRCALTNKTLLMRSDGSFIRDYIYVSDIVDGYILLAEKMIKRNIYGEAFNFSNEKPISVMNLVKRIYSLANPKGKRKVKILNKATHEIKKQYLCSKKARTMLGWKPNVSIAEGLLKTINWYKNTF